MAIILTILIIIVVVGMVVGLYQKNTNIICRSRNRLDGKTTIVTGGTAGMGLEIAMDFAYRGAKVIIACPFQEEGVNARNLIEKKSRNPNIIFKLLDLGSLKSVRGFAADILKTEDRLDILINNAGVGIPGDFLTADGMNFIMQVNYFGTFLLTLLLLPLLRKTGTPSDKSRIVNTSSVLHRFGRIEIDNLNRTGYWSKIRIYGNSKLCLVMFSHELSKRLKGSNVVINSVDPGLVGTRIFDSSTKSFGGFLSFMAGILFKHPWEGAQSAIFAATTRGAGEVSGRYFQNCQPYKPSESVNDLKLVNKLWEESFRLVKITNEELNECFPPS